MCPPNKVNQMSKFFLGLLVLLLTTNASVFSAPPDKKLHRKCLYPTVKLTSDEHDCGGTGFIVRSTKVGKHYRNVVITATHLLDRGLKVFVPRYKNWSTLDGYDDYPIELFAYSKDDDIAIVLFESERPMPVAELDFDSKYYIGTDVLRVGFGHLDDARLDNGRVTQPVTVDPSRFRGMIRTNVHTTFGDSGSALFLEENYKVIGLCHGLRMVDGDVLHTHSYYVPITRLKTMNAKANNALRFVYTRSERMPILPFVKLRLRQYEVTLPAEEKKE